MATERAASSPVGRSGGARVRIHEPRLRDQAEFLELVHESRGLHQGLMQPPENPAGYRAYLKRVRADRHAGFLLRRTEDDALVGVVNVNEIVRGVFQNAFLGYWIGSPYARQGYMGDGLRMVLRHAFGPLKLHRVEANIQPGNTASVALVRGLGFEFEGLSRRYLKISGRWRDHERFALRVEDWRPQR
jgi:ribosomal-protein-alanine N-acetyltransferase